MVVIRTSYKSNANGTGQIVAKCGGKQRTVNLDLSKSNDWNHGNAAGTLALVLGLPADVDIEHDSNDSGTGHGFAWWEVK